MSKAELKKLVEKYFSNPPADVPKWSFSEKWKATVCKEVAKMIKSALKKQNVLIIIGIAHNDECEKLLEKLNQRFKRSFSNLNSGKIKEEIDGRFEKFATKYNPTKGKDEFQYLSWIIEKKLKTISTKDTKEIDVHKAYESNKEAVLNPHDILEKKEQHAKEERKKENTDITSYLQELPNDILKRLASHLVVLRPDVVGNRLLLNKLFLEHTFPSRDFLLKDVPEEFNFLRDIEDFRLDVAGYSRYERIVESQERQFMLLAIEKLKECRAEFEEKNKKLLKEERKETEEKYPLLSAVAVDKNGGIIKTAFKGETGCMDNHCEYTLFEELFSDIDRERMKGGTLYVTLEPCNKRGLNKIPCAVRCVEAGISKIYIGTHDPDLTVKWNGITTIKTGKYSFNIDEKGNPVLNNDEEDIKKKIEAAKALMKVFDNKSYPATFENGIKTYTIGNPIGRDNVRLFHPDLSLEIIQLNKEFLKGRENNAFVSFDMPE